MLRTHLKLAARTLRRYSGYTAINIVGLTLGLSCFMVVVLYLHHETTYDTHHEHADRTYRLIQEVQSGAYAKVGFITTDRPRNENTGVLPPHLRDRVPEVEQATQFVHRDAEAFLRTDGRRTVVSDVLYTDDGGAFFDVFTFDFVAGTPGAALDAPGTAVLTTTTAMRLFGDDVAVDDLVGRTVDLNVGATPGPLTIRGIVADPPSTSHFRLDIAVRPPGPLPSWARTRTSVSRTGRIRGSPPVRSKTPFWPWARETLVRPISLGFSCSASPTFTSTRRSCVPPARRSMRATCGHSLSWPGWFS